MKRSDNGQRDALMGELRHHGEALSQLAESLREHRITCPSTTQALAPWVAIAITIGGLIASGSYFISLRPTQPFVEALIKERQEPITQAVQENKAALSTVAQENKAALKTVGDDLKKVGEDIREVRESQIREEARREPFIERREPRKGGSER